jgi:hypothetical protein
MDRRLGDVAQNRHVREQVEVLKHHAHVLACAHEVVLTEDLELSPVALLEAHEKTQDGALARPTGPYQRKLFRYAHVEVEVIEDERAPEPLDDPAHPHGQRFEAV